MGSLLVLGHVVTRCPTSTSGHWHLGCAVFSSSCSEHHSWETVCPVVQVRCCMGRPLQPSSAWFSRGSDCHCQSRRPGASAVVLWIFEANTVQHAFAQAVCVPELSPTQAVCVPELSPTQAVCVPELSPPNGPSRAARLVPPSVPVTDEPGMEVLA